MESKNAVSDLKEQTRLMYEKTIDEMRKRGATDDKLEVVERAKNDAMKAYDLEKNNEENELQNFVTIYDALEGGRKTFAPLMRNLFIVHLGNVPIYLVRSFYFSVNENEVSVSFYETAEFSPIKYFTENRKFNKIELEFIAQTGETMRVDRFEKVSVKKIMPDGLTYESGEPMGVYIKFKYKKYVPSAC